MTYRSFRLQIEFWKELKGVLQEAMKILIYV